MEASKGESLQARQKLPSCVTYYRHDIPAPSQVQVTGPAHTLREGLTPTVQIPGGRAHWGAS